MEDFNAWKDRLKENSNIVNVISKYATLTRKGKHWWACCPFHFEKTASFAVNEVEQFYHCYGCGVSGDVFTFVQKIEACDFIEACEILAKDANMKMPMFQDNENINKIKREKDVALKALRDAAVYYANNLTKPEGQAGRNYITTRKLTTQTVKDFGLGYSLGWNEVVTYLLSKGYSTQDLVLAGIVDQKDGKHFDAYSKRLIFPIINIKNEVIGFSARLLEKSDFAKYKNTAQTIVFNKGRVLYGLNNVRKLKQTERVDEIIIVEGQMDLIAMYQHGIKNVVATMGTALTPMHARDLKRFCNKVVLCFDGDAAGIKATHSSIEILSGEGLQVFVTTIPNGQDPDEFLKEHGTEKFEKIILGAKYWTQHLIDELAKNYNLQVPHEKNMFITKSLEIIKKLESSSEQVVYLELVKRFSNISLDVLKQDLKKLSLKTDKKQESSQIKEEDAILVNKENSFVKAMRFLIKAFLFKKEFANVYDISISDIPNPDYKRVYAYVKNSLEAGKKPLVGWLFSEFDAENNYDIKLITSDDIDESIDNETFYTDCVKTVKKYNLQQKQIELMNEIKQEGNLDKRSQLKSQLLKLMDELRKYN